MQIGTLEMATAGAMISEAHKLFRWSFTYIDVTKLQTTFA